MARLQQQLCAVLERHLAGEAVQIPEWSVPIWNAFTSLAERRQYSETGPQPIPYVEIDAWARLRRVPLEPHHVETIVALDRVWLSHARGATKAQQPRGDLTAALFDARFG